MEKSTREVKTCQNFQNQCLAAARYAAISLGTTGAGEFKLPSGNGLPFWSVILKSDIRSLENLPGERKNRHLFIINDQNPWEFRPHSVGWHLLRILKLTVLTSFYTIPDTVPLKNTIVCGRSSNSILPPFQEMDGSTSIQPALSAENHIELHYILNKTGHLLNLHLTSFNIIYHHLTSLNII